MIVFDLACSRDHIFEAWFGSTGDFEAQRTRGLIACPTCDDLRIRKAAMAPAVPVKGNSNVAEARSAMDRLRAEIEASADYVGDEFSKVARAVHYGETPRRNVYGEASLIEAAALIEDVIEIAALPFSPRRRRDS